MEARVHVINVKPLWGSFVDVHIHVDGRHLTGEFIAVGDLVSWFAEHRRPYWTSNLVVIPEALEAVAEAVRHLLTSDEATGALLVCADDEEDLYR